MAKLDGLKFEEAQEILFEKRKTINDFLKNLEWEVKLDDSMNFWAHTELFFPTGSYEISAEKFDWENWLRPSISIDHEWKNHKIKATKFLRVSKKDKKRDELLEMYNDFINVRNSMREDAEDLWKKQVAKVEDTTKKWFLRLIGLRPKKK